MIRFSKFHIALTIGLLISFLPIFSDGKEYGNNESIAEDDITGITAVDRFYEAIKNHRCEEAIQLRPGYTKNKCQEIETISNYNARLQYIDVNSERVLSVIDLNVTIHKAEKKENWRGFLTLIKRKNDQWKIVNESYISQKEIGNISNYLSSPKYLVINRSPVLARTVQISPSEHATPSLKESLVESVETGNDLVSEGGAPKPPQPVSVNNTSEIPRAKDAVSPQSIAIPQVQSLVEHQGPNYAVTQRPGATNVLDACWSPKDLRSLPGERTIRATTANYSPPKRLYPLRPNGRLGMEFARSVRSVNPVQGEKLVALTFDLCEQANETTGYDGEIVDILRAEKANATFYAGGKWMRSHPERTMQLIADPLFEIGNHAWTHGNMRVLRGREMEEQIQWTQAQYEILRDQLLNLPCASSIKENEAQRIPALPSTFRFPYGACDATAMQAVAQAGLYPIQWNIVSGDPAQKQTAGEIVKEILYNIRPGSIVIAHANGRGWHTAEALKILIPALKEKGYRFVTVSQLLKSGNPLSVESCYEKRPGDNLKYDKLFGRGTE